MDEQCLFCRHYIHGDDDDDEEPDMGYCRRYPPQIAMEDDGIASIFPLVREDSCCGEFNRRVM